MKHLRRILDFTVLSFLTICRENVGQKVDYLNFRIDFIEGLLVKCAMWCKIPGCHGDDSTVKRLIQEHFASRIAPTEKKHKKKTPWP
jgi:hypothetical protein